MKYTSKPMAAIKHMGHQPIIWFASKTKLRTVIQEIKKEELSECLTMFYARREDGKKFKVHAIKR